MINIASTWENRNAWLLKRENKKVTDYYCYRIPISAKVSSRTVSGVIHNKPEIPNLSDILLQISAGLDDDTDNRAVSEAAQILLKWNLGSGQMSRTSSI